MVRDPYVESIVHWFRDMMAAECVVVDMEPVYDYLITFKEMYCASPEMIDERIHGFRHVATVEVWGWINFHAYEFHFQHYFKKYERIESTMYQRYLVARSLAMTLGYFQIAYGDQMIPAQYGVEVPILENIIIGHYTCMGIYLQDRLRSCKLDRKLMKADEYYIYPFQVSSPISDN